MWTTCLRLQATFSMWLFSFVYLLLLGKQYVMAKKALMATA